MKKVFMLLGALILSDHAIALHARNHLSSMYIRLSSEPPELRVSYTGYLYNRCLESGWRFIEGNKVTILFIFPQTDGSKRVIERIMGVSCTTPSGYMYPTEAVYSDHGSDHELWSEIHSQLGANSGGELFVELAFEYQGRWDSDFGNNYRLHLK